jgi:WD40 repeat protein
MCLGFCAALQPCTAGAGNDINTIELRPSDAAALASAGTDTVVRVYDESTGQQVVALDHGEHCTAL